MKSRANELLDRSVAAMISAIEIYNKPNFEYREETFSILAINSWELLLKSKWLRENSNKINSLYVYTPRIKKDGSNSKIKTIKSTRSGNQHTHGLDYLAHQLINKNILDHTAWGNIKALVEIRDSSIHFYNKSSWFSLRLQEVGAATLKNYVALMNEWFDKDLASYNFYLMPLCFMATDSQIESISLNKEEKKFIQFIEKLEENDDPGSKFSITVNIDVKFTRSKSKDALNFRITNDINATEVVLTEEQIREKYRYDYKELAEVCRNRYESFKVNNKYHQIRKSFLGDKKYCSTRMLDPGNPKSVKKDFYSASILNEFDKNYSRK
jgi:hypothetical protein